MPVAGTKQHQDQQQQEAEGQPCGQGAGGCRVKAGLKVGRAENSTPSKAQGAGSEVKCTEKVRGQGSHRVREPSVEGSEREGAKR